MNKGSDRNGGVGEEGGQRSKGGVSSQLGPSAAVKGHGKGDTRASLFEVRLKIRWKAMLTEVQVGHPEQPHACALFNLRMSCQAQ